MDAVLAASSPSGFYSSAESNIMSTTSSSYSIFSSSSPSFFSLSLSSSPPPPPPPASSSHFASNASTFAERVGGFVHVMIACVFAAVGSLVGAVTGGLIGLASESGLLRGAGIGAISGAVFTIEAFESSLAIWRIDESGMWSLLFVIDILCSLLNGRLVREKVGPAMLRAVQSLMSAVDSPLMEAIDIFDTGSARGMTKESVDRLPKISINSENIVDDVGERICCVVCLQDFEIGDTVRCLPHCQHKFHMPCIDGWLISHGSCPLCRRDL